MTKSHTPLPLTPPQVSDAYSHWERAVGVGGGGGGEEELYFEILIVQRGISYVLFWTETARIFRSVLDRDAGDPSNAYR